MSEIERTDEIGAPLVVPRAGLRAALVRGAAWTAGANVVASALNAVVGIALARLLSPDDFGIQTAVVTITAFFGTVLDVGLGSSVVQREELGQPALSSVCWAGALASLALYAAVAASSPLVARLFGAPVLVHVLPVAALNILVLGAVIVPAALLRRRLAFGVLARTQAAGAMAGAAVAVTVALAGGRYWALIGYSLASVVVSAALVARTARWRPSLTLVPAHLAPLRGYAGSMMSFLAVNYWSRNLDDLLIGRFLGIGPLGIFSLAQRLVGAPLQLLTGSIAPLLHPTFAAMGDDVRRQRAAYLDLVRATALLTFPVSAVLFVLAEPIVLAVGGDAWLPSAAVMRALCLLAAVQPVNMLCGAVFMARNAAHVMLRCATVGAVAVVVGMVCGLRYHVAGVAWGYSIAYLLVAAPVSTLVAFRLLHGRAVALGRALVRPLLTGLLLLALAQALSLLLPRVLGPVPALALTVATSAAALAAALAPTARRMLGARRRAPAAA